MKLKPRLALVASKIPDCGRIFDIGTDHAYLPVFLALNGKEGKLIASDVKPGPLRVARRNIRRYRCEEKIETLISDGMKEIFPAENDVLVIAGMGGKLITDILDAYPEKSAVCKALVIQPNYAAELVREWFSCNGYEILDEALCKEEKRIYNVMVACKKKQEVSYREESAVDRASAKQNRQCFSASLDTGRIAAEPLPGRPFTAKEYYVGKKLLENSDPLMEEYLKKKISELERIVWKIMCNTEKKRQYVKWMEELNVYYKEILKNVK